jgi:hypothetical protein
MSRSIGNQKTTWIPFFTESAATEFLTTLHPISEKAKQKNGGKIGNAFWLQVLIQLYYKKEISY